MDIGTAIIGTIIVAVCAMPFVLMNRGRKKREKQVQKALMDLAERHDCQIDQYEICNNLGIGMDKDKNVVFFYRSTEGVHDEQYIYLDMTKSCKVINTGRNLKTNNGNQRIIDRLELSLVPNVKEGQEVKLEFFDSEVDPQLNGQFQLIEKWSGIINDQLTGHD